VSEVVRSNSIGFEKCNRYHLFIGESLFAWALLRAYHDVELNDVRSFQIVAARVQLTFGS
jgi:hypothetical protein